MNDNPEIHSRRVARLKLVLPGLAVFVLGLLVIFSRSGNDIIQLAIFDGTDSGGGIVLREPVMRGTSSANVPYEISAATAHTQDAANALINLRDVDAQFEPVGAAPGYVIEAKTGLMNNETGLLNWTTASPIATITALFWCWSIWSMTRQTGPDKRKSRFRHRAARHA